MQTRRDSSDEFWAGVVMVAVIAAVAVCAALLARMLSELIRIYATRAKPGSATARPLWGALTALLATWLAAGVLLSVPSLAAVGVYLAAWAFLAYVIFVEAIDQRAARSDRAALGPVGDLDTYLEPFTPELASSPNGATPDLELVR